MIARLHFPYRQRLAEAVLQEDGRWCCPEVPSLVRVLDALYSPGPEGSPSDRPRAIGHVQAAARWLKGTVEAGTGHPERN